MYPLCPLPHLEDVSILLESGASKFPFTCRSNSNITEPRGNGTSGSWCWHFSYCFLADRSDGAETWIYGIMKASGGQGGQGSVVNSSFCIFPALLISIWPIQFWFCRLTLNVGVLPWLNCSTALKDVSCLVHVTLPSCWLFCVKSVEMYWNLLFKLLNIGSTPIRKFIMHNYHWEKF